MSDNETPGASGTPPTDEHEARVKAVAEENVDGLAKETQGLSQGQIVRKRFKHNTGAVFSVFALLATVLLAYSSIGFGPVPGWWEWNYRETPEVIDGGSPTLSFFPPSLGPHPFGQDNLGRDLFAMTMRGTQMTLLVMVLIGAITAVIGTVIGAVSGYFRGKIEGILMRFTDVIIIMPLLIIAAVLGRMATRIVEKGVGQVALLGVMVGLLAWTALARLVRAEILSLREREFVDAARLAGASDTRIIFKHILPNAIGVITVNLTLLLAAAVLLETGLSYLGFGVQPPDWSLGRLISANQTAFQTRPWLFWWPGFFIIVICLSINFIGDGLRDAFDPRQKKFNPKKATEAKGHMLDETDLVRQGADTTGVDPGPTKPA